jgi:dTMP kinase
MDLGLHADPSESYRLFQKRIQEEYERIVPEYGLAVMDATLPVEAQQRVLRDLIRPHLHDIVRDPRTVSPEPEWHP